MLGLSPPMRCGRVTAVLKGGRSRPVFVAAVEDHEGVRFSEEILLIQLVGAELECGHVLGGGIGGGSSTLHSPEGWDPLGQLLHEGRRDPGQVGHSVRINSPHSHLRASVSQPARILRAPKLHPLPCLAAAHPAVSQLFSEEYDGAALLPRNATARMRCEQTGGTHGALGGFPAY